MMKKRERKDGKMVEVEVQYAHFPILLLFALCVCRVGRVWCGILHASNNRKGSGALFFFG